MTRPIHSQWLLVSLQGRRVAINTMWPPHGKYLPSIKAIKELLTTIVHFISDFSHCCAWTLDRKQCTEDALLVVHGLWIYSPSWLRKHVEFTAVGVLGWEFSHCLGSGNRDRTGSWAVELQGLPLVSPFLQQAPPPRGSSASLNSITNSLQTHGSVLDTLVDTYLYFSVPFPGLCTSETTMIKCFHLQEPVCGEVNLPAQSWRDRDALNETGP